MKNKTCVIYDNYDLWEDYKNDAMEFLKSEYPELYITDTELWNEIYFYDECNWKNEKIRLKDFFTGHGYFLLMGYNEYWNGKYAAGYLFNDFEDMFYKAVKDCDYWKFWDENGHFYFKCSHHDGTNIYEIKRVSEKGYNFIDNWNYNYNDKRTEEEIHSIVWNSNFLSSLPHYAKNIYGC